MNFAVKPLGELCRLTMGRTPPRGNSKYWGSSGKTKNIWISIADMTKSADGNLTDSKEYLSDEGSKTFPKVKAGTLLLSFKLSIGKLAIAGVDLQTNEAIAAINDLNEELILRDYLFYYLFGFDWSEALEGRFKVKGNTLNKKILEALPIKFPSIEKQSEIVARLHSALAEIELSYQKTTASLEFISSCFDSFLDSILQNQILKCGESKLVEVLDIARGGSPRPIDQYLTNDENGVNWIKISDATSSKKYITETAQKIRPDGVSRSRLVNPGDFLLSNSMSFGRPYIMRTTGCIHDGWLVLSNNKKLLNQDYLYYVLGSKYIYEQFNRAAAGSTVRNLNISLAGQVTFPVPSIETQESIISRLIDLEESVDEFKESLTSKLNMLAELKNSLLSSAFDLSVSSNAVV